MGARHGLVRPHPPKTSRYERVQQDGGCDAETVIVAANPGVRHVIINCFAPIADGHIQLCPWLFRNDTARRSAAQGRPSDGLPVVYSVYRPLMKLCRRS